MANPLKPSDLKQSAINIKTRFVAISWRDLAISFGPIALLAIFAIWLAIKFIHPAPPSTITISTGSENSSFWKIAEKYRTILARNGIKLKIVSSEGSLDNLKKLSDPHSGIDVGFVQGGVAGDLPIDGLVSLGSISYVPVSVFYRGRERLDRLSELRGKRVAIGVPGSGSRVLALTLLKANEIELGGSTELLDMGGDEAAQALTDGTIDAAFLMGDSASPPTMIKLLHTPGISLLDFSQAGAYARRFSYLNELRIPKGLFDLGKNIPSRDIRLIAPTAELIARDDLHPALSDMLIDAAKEVHSGANVLQHAGEFPAPLAHEYPISEDATRYYKSGKSFFYRSGLPFWLASLVDRTLVVLLPIILLLIPGFKLVPLLYGWRIKSRIYRWYGALITLERAVATHTEEEQADLLQRLDRIEEGVNRMKMPLAFADQFYVLREHIGFVRARLQSRG
ncbi:TAXI family TRAP transporter solute-binding subunit [Collimonas pratensis]|uniref:NMT1/THI5 like family protein n=1 Tax=Collimonas pratensis TaxID=279113 RepID=A0A127Q566_9BURK|nr:TAXI family TRAP transporter solute-binding subunit [Collimonas pratensis]AMP04772.1 NMT1/THI5 like family protein [Collimonas pratensis]AMP15183.1 NMT1/THI5 like family protein [Collimonas pratensis]NKI69602.1 ABC transporter substrate-binding protein [Collimonas pratensis]